jgi:formate/nitrite transporter FocA (FNT family)
VTSTTPNVAEEADLHAEEGAAPRKDSSEILRDELQEAMDALDRPAGRLCFSGIAAGLEIGFSLFLMATVRKMSQGRLPEPVTNLLVANMYSFGFVLVVLGRSELFTEQTSLAVMPVLARRASVGSVLRLWGIIFVSNLVGAALFARLAAYIGPELGVFDRATLGEIAHSVVDHPGLTIFVSGVLAGWLMGLLSWLVAAGRDTISQIVIVWLITTAIGLERLHHAVLGTAEVLGGVFASDMTWADFAHFLLWATLGNAVGGPVFVALLKTAHTKSEQ